MLYVPPFSLLFDWLSNIRGFANCKCPPHADFYCVASSILPHMFPSAIHTIVLSCSWIFDAGTVQMCIHLMITLIWDMMPYNPVYEVCSEKDRTFAIKTLFYNIYWRYTVPNVSSIVGMLPGTHFLWWHTVLLSHCPESLRVQKKTRLFK